MLLDELKQLNTDSWCLDGFPRTLYQATAFDRLLVQAGSSLDLVISMEVPDAEILRRVHDRWIHPASGRSYSLSFNPPIKAGFDDATCEPLVRRIDDQSSTVEHRLAIYHQAKDPILAYYEQSGRLIRVEGNDSKSIYAQLLDALSLNRRILLN